MVVTAGVALAVLPALTAPAVSASAGTRYVDPVFSGSLAPVTEISYDPSVPLNSRHTLTVFAVSGTYTLTYRGATTAPIARGATATQVQAALQALATVDHDGSPGADVTVTGGVGAGAGGKHYRVTFTDTLPLGDSFGRLTASDVSLTGGQDKVVVRCDRCADVYRPDEASPPAGGRPVVVLLHGGGFSGGAKDAESGDSLGVRMETWATALAERGYVVVPANYSLEDPADLPFAACDWDAVSAPACPTVWQDALTAARHDAQAAVRWLRLSASPVASGGLDNPFGIDPARIVVAGESAGAMVALGALYRSDDPGSVGVTGVSSTVAAGVSVSGLTVDAWQDAGEGPALLMGATNDPMAEIWGSDFFEEHREVEARAAALGNVAQLHGWCTRYDQSGDAIADPVHLFDLARPEWTEQVDVMARFLARRVVGPAPSGAGAAWNGAGRTPPLAASPVGQTLHGGHEPVVGDFDGDGVDDIVWFGPGDECDTVWWGEGDGTFVDPDEVNGGVYAHALDLAFSADVVSGDFDGDGADDLWFADEPAPGSYRVVTTGGTRTFASSSLDGFDAELSYRTGDFDADGHDDLALYWSAGGMGLVGYGGATAAGFTDLELVTLVAGGQADVGDVDGDGRDDLVVVAPGGTRIAYGLPRPDAAAFDVRSLAAPVAGTPVVLDADGDGRTDVFTHVSGGSSTLWYGDSARGTLLAGKSWVLSATMTPAVGDVDGDSKSDLVWHTPPTGATTVWFGTTSRTWLPFWPATGLTAEAGWSPVVIELDGVAAPGGGQRADLLWHDG